MFAYLVVPVGRCHAILGDGSITHDSNVTIYVKGYDAARRISCDDRVSAHEILEHLLHDIGIYAHLASYLTIKKLVSPTPAIICAIQSAAGGRVL